MRNNEQLIFIDKNFNKKPVCNCFWCDRRIFKSSLTIDHLVSKCYARRNGYRYDTEENLKLACEECNLERNEITQLYLLANSIRTGRPVKKIENWILRKENIKEKIKKFIKLIESRVKNEQIKRLMLREINLIQITEFKN